MRAWCTAERIDKVVNVRIRQDERLYAPVHKGSQFQVFTGFTYGY